MFNLKSLLDTPYGYHDYIWVEVIVIKETPKAILIEFDGRKAWLSKAWIIKTVGASSGGDQISIKISLYHWAKKFE